MSRRTGRFRALARWKASSLHGYQSTGWPIARLRYGECSSARWLGLGCATAQDIHPKTATSTSKTLSLICNETQEHQQSFKLGAIRHPARRARERLLRGAGLRQLSAEKIANGSRHLPSMRLQREVPRVVKVHLAARVITLKGFGARRQEKGIILAVVHEVSKRAVGSSTTPDRTETRAIAPVHVAFRAFKPRRRPGCFFWRVAALQTKI